LKDVLVPWHLQAHFVKNKPNHESETLIYKRYYHLFEKGELEELIFQATLLIIIIILTKQIKFLYYKL
jgi:hypothetical protein